MLKFVKKIFKSGIIISTLLFFFIGCKQKYIAIKLRYPSGKIGVLYEYPDKWDTLNFYVKSFYENGTLSQYATVRNGKVAGSSISYYPSGAISEIDSLSRPAEFPAINWDGIAIFFYPNGKPSGHFVVKNGADNGFSQHYDSSGRLVKTYYLKNDTIKDGLYTEYYPSGKVLRTLNYVNDTITGFEYIFKENGDTLKYFGYFRGRRSFPVKKWLQNGDILIGEIVDDKTKAVKWIWYGKNGDIVKKEIQFPHNGSYIHPE